MKRTDKILLRRADALYRVDDKIAGYTAPGRCYRRDCRKAVRHARRAGKALLRTALAEA